MKAFDIDMVGTEGKVTFTLDETFFGHFEKRLIEQGALVATVEVKKTPHRVQLLMVIDGEIVLVCDRSLEVFDHPVHIAQEITFKLGNENRELDVNLYMIDPQTTTINVAQHLYDFVSLAVPIKKLHPKLLYEVLSSTCDQQ